MKRLLSPPLPVAVWPPEANYRPRDKALKRVENAMRKKNFFNNIQQRRHSTTD